MIVLGWSSTDHILKVLNKKGRDRLAMKQGRARTCVHSTSCRDVFSWNRSLHLFYTHTYTQILLKISLHIKKVIVNYRNLEIRKKSIFQENWLHMEQHFEILIMFNTIVSGFLLVQSKSTYFWERSNLVFICNMSQNGGPRKCFPHWVNMMGFKLWPIIP